MNFPRKFGIPDGSSNKFLKNKYICIYLQNPRVTYFCPHATGQEFLINSFRLDKFMQN